MVQMKDFIFLLYFIFWKPILYYAPETNLLFHPLGTYGFSRYKIHTVSEGIIKANVSSGHLETYCCGQSKIYQF